MVVHTEVLVTEISGGVRERDQISERTLFACE